jgi:hypothetical protein
VGVGAPLVLVIRPLGFQPSQTLMMSLIFVALYPRSLAGRGILALPDDA